MKNILIAPAHYRIYRSAARLLARRMGAHAPSTETLIRHELSQRTPRLIADEYLENWFSRRRRSGRMATSAHDPRRN